jgi:hypothetical protein
LSTFRKLLTRRIALALAAASTVLFGWVGQPNAAAVHYTVKGSAVFNEGSIPDPPPESAFVTITGSFDFDAATQTQSNVILNVEGDLDPGLYAAVFPRNADHMSGSCELCDILSGRPPETNKVQVFTETITITFAQPLGDPSVVDPITRVSIFGFVSGNPCTRFPGCLSDTAVGDATPSRARVPVSEPTSFAVFAPASLLCLSFYWANRRRRSLARVFADRVVWIGHP